MRIIRVIYVLLFSLFLTISSSTAVSATPSYTLKLTVTEVAAEEEISIFDGDGDFLDQKNGIRTCSKPKVFIDLGKPASITKGTKIRITNASGKILNIASLNTVKWTQTGQPEYAFTDAGGQKINSVTGTCSFSQAIKLPKSNFYSFSLSGVEGSYPTFDYTFQDLQKKKWVLSLKF